jgi:type II secretory pathway pseudopilin PulG
VRASQARDAHGETLIETLISVILLGLLASGIVAALATTINASDLDARQSAAEPALRSYAAAWSRVAYQACTASSTANPYGATDPSGYTAPSGFTASVASVKFWDGTSTSPAVFAATCPSGGDQGLQEVTLQVRPPRGATQTIAIDKRAS